MKIVFALLLIVLAQADYQIEFNLFKILYGKVYSSVAEETFRLNIFINNTNFIDRFDAEDRGFYVAMNQFGDLSSSEFVHMYDGMHINLDESVSDIQSPSSSIQGSVDWVSSGAVTGIKNQYKCGSCWAFATTGAVEGAHFLSTGNLVSLSEQNLIDCSTAQGNAGCEGGLMDAAFSYIISNDGIDTEANYTYTATGPNDCRFYAQVGATISSFTDVASGNETALANAVNAQPVAVAIDASHSSFQFYSSGVYYEPACSSSALDHGVLVVGYGTEGSSDFWYVKNSWGASWGMSGYIRMARNRNNNCGIATAASYPVV